MPGPEIVAEQATTSATCSRPGQSICNSSSEAVRSLPSSSVRGWFTASSLALPVLRLYQRRRQPQTVAPGDQRHSADPLRQLANRPQHLELELRDAVAVIGQRKTLDHHIGRTAIGGRIARALLGRYQRIGGLRLGAAMDAQFDPVRGRSRGRPPTPALCPLSRPRKARRRHYRNSCTW